MRKYPKNQSRCKAVYDKGIPNPLLAAMPEMLPKDVFMNEISSRPPLQESLKDATLEERRRMLPILSSLFLPMDYMYAIYDQLYRAITTTYTTITSTNNVRQVNDLFNGAGGNGLYATQAESGSVLGVPGIGKTSTIYRCLLMMPQVLEHTRFQNQPFFCKQILYLRVECPSDCSIKTLAYNIFGALGRAIGAEVTENLYSIKSAAASALSTEVKILCSTFNVGLILVDEIQNAVLSAKRNNQIRPLIKFLVELTNDTSTAVYFVGAPIAEELFTSQEHLQRRTRGIRLLPLKPDGTYRAFLKMLWPYQLTESMTPLTEKMANKLFDYSGGIPANIVKIFQESQAQALLMGQKCMTEKTMQRAIDILSIRVPKNYARGTYLSDFCDYEEKEPAQKAENDGAVESGSTAVPRLYAKKRGRKATARRGEDLVAAYKTGVNLMEHLKAYGMVERWPIC